jgi:hypothetical protein
MLLNEFLKEHRTVQEQGAMIARQQKQIERIANRVWLTVPQATEWQRIGNQINAVLIGSRSNLVNVQRLITFQWTLLSP